MTLDREAPMLRRSGKHRCATEADLSAELERLLGKARTPREFSEQLKTVSALGGCRPCHVRIMDLAIARANRERDSLKRRFERYSPSTICRLILESRPRAWPPERRWPELEAVAESAAPLGNPSGGATLTRTLRNLLASAVEEPSVRPRVEEVVRYLRQHLLTHSSLDQLSWAGCLARDESLLVEAFRRAHDEIEEDEPEAECVDEQLVWDSAFEFLGESGLTAHDRPTWPPERQVSETRELATNVAARAREASLVRSQKAFNPKVAFRYATSIENSVANLAELESTATQVCAEVVEQGFPFAGVSLIRLDQRTIEAIAGYGDAAEWVGRVRHPIHPDLPLAAQDIQCHVALSERAEMVEPTDPRLDPFVRDHFRHTARRYFIPLLIAYDEYGRHIHAPNNYRWVVVEGQNWQLRVVHPPGATVRVFGTLEVGISNASQPSLDEFLRLANFSLERASAIYRCTLARVFDTIVTLIRRLSGSKTATLHHGRRGEDGIRWAAHYCFRSESGKAPCLMSPANREGAIGGNPRPGGLGETCIHEGQPVVRRGEELRNSNPLIYAENIRSMVALPMFAGTEVGVVFLHREDEAGVPKSLMLWVMFLVDRASAAILQARSYTEERRRRFQLMGQQKTARALFEAVGKSSKLEDFITGSLLNLSSADLALLYRVRAGYCDAAPWSSAGFRMGKVQLDRTIAPLIQRVAHTGAARLFRVSDWHECESLPEGDGMKAALIGARRFTLAERVNYLGILPIGSTVLVFAYRRTSEPARSEQRNLEQLASTVSVALEMGRTLASKQDLLNAAYICRSLELNPQPLQLRSS